MDTNVNFSDAELYDAILIEDLARINDFTQKRGSNFYIDLRTTGLLHEILSKVKPTIKTSDMVFSNGMVQKSSCNLELLTKNSQTSKTIEHA